MKLCKKCGVEYPATLEFFYRCPTTKDGLRYRCKTCGKQSGNKYRHTTKARFEKYYGKNA